jgi:hypothetical protein
MKLFLILGRFYCRETSLGFNSVFQTFFYFFFKQTCFKPVLNPNRFFFYIYIGVKLKLVSETHQTTSGCGFGGLTSVQNGDR